MKPLSPLRITIASSVVARPTIGMPIVIASTIASPRLVQRIGLKKKRYCAVKAGKIEIADFADAARRLRVHADEVERHASRGIGEDIAAEAPPALLQMIHDDDAARLFAAIAHARWHHDAVLDHAHRASRPSPTSGG